MYLGAEDVTEELDGIGAVVNFTLYSDSTGLGASDCKAGGSVAAKPGSKAGANFTASGKLATSSAVAAYKAANSPSAQAAAQKAAAKARAAPVQNRSVASKPGSNFTASGKLATSNAVAAYKAANTPAAKAAAAKTAKSVQQTAWKKQAAAPAWKSAAQGGGEGGGGKWKKQQAEEGEREMLHDEFLIGTIKQWKGKFGWVTPDDTIEHPLSEMHNGDLYLKQEDVEEEIEGVGSRVQFMLYSDGKGLGACQVGPAEE